MNSFRQVWAVVQYDFRRWRRNSRVFVAFALAFIMCFLLTDKAVTLSLEWGTPMQFLEPFIWTFGDGNSILLISLLLILLFADMPFLSPATPFYLSRINRRVWVIGQMVYVALATTLFMVFVLVSTVLICMKNSFAGNIWSHTAAILGYSGIGEEVALPALVKTLEMSAPYRVVGSIFILMLLYALLMVFFMLAVTIARGQAAGITAVFGFSLYGFLLNPQVLKEIFRIEEDQMYRANVAFGWLSPLNHATYHMHNFGYDLLPRLWQTYLVFAVGIGLCLLMTLYGIRRYNFPFRGTETE